MGSSLPVQQVRTIVTLTDYHQLIHEGKGFTVCHVFEDVDIDAEAEILIRNGKYESHISLGLGAAGAAIVELFEGTVVDAFGTPLTSRNYNRQYAMQPDVVNEGTWVRIYHTPTMSDDGTRLTKYYIFGPTQTINKVGGADIKSAQEWVISPGGLYLLKATSKATDNIIVMKIDYYEYRGS